MYSLSPSTHTHSTLHTHAHHTTSLYTCSTPPLNTHGTAPHPHEPLSSLTTHAPTQRISIPSETAANPAHITAQHFTHTHTHSTAPETHTHLPLVHIISTHSTSLHTAQHGTSLYIALLSQLSLSPVQHTILQHKHTSPPMPRGHTRTRLL